MPTSCPVDLDVPRLLTEIRSVYALVAADPDGDFHFHRGLEYAVDRLGYDRALLESLPADNVASFAGVGHPFTEGMPLPGEVVVDIGSGAGTDLMVAARAVGPTGRAIGVDMTSAMLAKAARGAESAGLPWVELREGSADRLPVADATVDLVISNGVINLAPDKDAVFREIARVLRPGGRVQLSDIVVGVELTEGARRDVDLWTG